MGKVYDDDAMVNLALAVGALETTFRVTNDVMDRFISMYTKMIGTAVMSSKQSDALKDAMVQCWNDVMVMVRKGDRAALHKASRFMHVGEHFTIYWQPELIDENTLDFRILPYDIPLQKRLSERVQLAHYLEEVSSEIAFNKSISEHMRCSNLDDRVSTLITKVSCYKKRVTRTLVRLDSRGRDDVLKVQLLRGM